MRCLSLILAVLCAAPSLGAELRCAGDAPDWTLEVSGQTARFVFPSPTQMEVMLDTAAEGRDWPRAFTLIGDRDTAILLVEQESCGTSPVRAHVMTQRGQTPILLTGCCTGTAEK